MKKILLVLALTLSALGQAPAPPIGYVQPIAQAALGANGFSYTRIDPTGALYVTGTVGPGQSAISGYTTPYAPVALDASGNWHYLLVDATGALKTSGSGSGGTAFPVTVSGTVNSGGIPCFTSTTVEASSVLLTSNVLVKGGGAGGCPGNSALTDTGALLSYSGTTGLALTGAGAILSLPGPIEGSAIGSVLNVVGGQDASTNTVIGGLYLRGGSETGIGGSSSQAGGVSIAGGNNAAVSAVSQAGVIEITPGLSTGATQGLQGLLMVQNSYVKGGGTSTLWNLQCWTAAMTVNDCGASPSSILGVAESVNSNTVQVNRHGSQTPINASAAVTLGHTVCAGTTAGTVTDSGGTGPCATGFTVGVVLATSGTWTLPDLTSFTATTTLPLIAVLNVSAPPLISTSAVTPNMYAADTGAVNAYVVTLSPAMAAYTTGVMGCFKASAANTNAAPTVNFNGLGVKTIVKLGNTTLAGSDIGTVEPSCVVYDGANFVLLNPQQFSGAGSFALNSGPSFLVRITTPLIATTTKCAAVGTTANPSVVSCAAAPAGVFSCNNTTSGTCTVNTTAMLTANSTVIVTEDDSTTTGTLLGVTCNATPSVVNPSVITAKVAATSFSFTATAATDNPKCFQYFIVN